MRNDADFLPRSPRGGRGSFFPSSIRSISNYLRSVSANASSIAASTVRRAAVSAASNGALNEDDRQREQVQWANFDKLELETGEICQVLLLTYLNGFQVWDVEDASDVHELVSRRDGPVAFLRLQPKPIVPEPPDGGGGFKGARPLLLVVTGDTAGNPSPGGFSGGYSGGAAGSPLGVNGSNLVPTIIRFYSLQNHSYVHVLRFRTGIYAVRCSPRVVAVALVAQVHESANPHPNRTPFPAVDFKVFPLQPLLLEPFSFHEPFCLNEEGIFFLLHGLGLFLYIDLGDGACQIYCFDAGTLHNVFSVLTYPSPAPAPGTIHAGYGAMALGPRWLAYAANQPLMATTGRISPQHLTPSPGVSPSTSPANGSLVAHYAKESSKHLVAGVVTLGDMGYKTISRYCSELMPDGGTGSPVSGSPNWKNSSNGHNTWQGGPPIEPEYAGTVIVRDFVSKTIVAQFRAHSSPLSALAFDPSGTLLVTASVYGHNLNVFRLTPPSTAGANTAGLDVNTSYVHLYKLYRGVTNAVIQDISFSGDSQWIAVSSSRGTNHLFAISPFGGVVGPQTHGTVPIDGLIGPTLIPAPAFPWWSSTGPARVNQQALPPPPPAINLNVVSRIKNGNSGWRGTVTSAAVAAAGRPNALAGAVAAVFHAGGAAGVESEIETGTLKDQLWILYPTGHLLRYVLRPTAGDSNGVTGMAGVSAPGSPGLPQELKVVVEPLERWDVCRRPNWMEREERIDSQRAFHEDAGHGVRAKSSGMLSQGGSPGMLGKEGMTIEEMQCWFMSNAEVQMHQARPLPIWAKAKIYFHVMLSGVPNEAEGDDGLHGDGAAETEIESIPTRVVEVRRKDLVPVIKRLQNFTQVQGARDVMVSEALPGVSGVHEQLLGDEGLQDGFINGGLRPMQIKRTSSCSSLASEDVPAAMNGFHHAYQEAPGIVVTSNHPSSFEGSSPSYFHRAQRCLDPPSIGRPGSSQGILSSPKDGTAEFFQVSFGSQAGNLEGGGIANGSPPIYISMPHRRDVGVLSGYAKSDQTTGCTSPGRSTNRGRDGNNTRLEGLKRNGSGPISSDISIDGQLNHAVAHIPAPIGDTESMVVTNQVFGDLGLQETQGIEHLDLGAERNVKSPWDTRSTAKASGVQSVGNGGLSLGLHSGSSSTSKSNTNPEVESAFLYNHDGHQGSSGVLSEGTLDGSPAHEDLNGAIDDAESVGAHSKSEDNEGVEQGDDVWEGAMFPFCEDC